MPSPSQALRFEPPRLLPLALVLERAGVSKSTLYALIRAGQFPAPVKVRRCTRWRSPDVEAFVLATGAPNVETTAAAPRA